MSLNSQRELTPFNIAILNFTPERAKLLPQVLVQDTFEGATQNFHQDGLFSLQIFGANGSEDRDKQFAYINIKINVIHPFVLKTLFKLKAAYKDLVYGRGYFSWDETEKDFVPSDALEGETGFHFFLKHWKDIKHKPSTSKRRDQMIEMVEKYKEVSETSRILVVPAGLRDISVDETGRFKQSEVNDFYRSLIGISNIVSNQSMGDQKIMDNTRLALQNTFIKIYDFFNGLIEGKRGFIQAKATSRNIFYGTRNVITSMEYSIDDLGDEAGVGVNHTTIGLTQFMFNVTPLVRHKILSLYSEKYFAASDNKAFLIDPQTLRKELVVVSPEVTDKWTTTAGIDKLIKNMIDVSFRTKPIVINGRYLALVYRSEDSFKIFSDIEEFPKDKGFSEKDIHPLTYVEMFYLCAYREWNRYPSWMTRYPITGIGSIYPSFSYVKTTTRGLVLKELGDDWNPIGPDHIAREYPDLNNPVFHDSLSPSSSRLAGLGGDFDGDTMSCNTPMTEEAIQEAIKLLNDPAMYVNPLGGVYATAGIPTVKRNILNMSGD